MNRCLLGISFFACLLLPSVVSGDLETVRVFWLVLFPWAMQKTVERGLRGADREFAQGSTRSRQPL